MVKKVWRTDGQTDRRTDRQTDWTSHVAAWSQLKTETPHDVISGTRCCHANSPRYHQWRWSWHYDNPSIVFSIYQFQLISPKWNIYVSLNWVIVGLNNGLSLIQCQAIISSNDNFSSITPQGKDFTEKIIETDQFSLIKLHLMLLSVILSPFCPGGQELIRKYGNACYKNYKHISCAFTKKGSFY